MIRHQYRPVLGVRHYLAAALATMLTWASPVFALPSTPVIAGNNGTGIAATFDTTIPNSLTVNQTATNTRVVIDWNSFNIASGEHVTFSQPSKSSIAFNVVPASAGVTNILGSLNANGGVWLFSPGGIIFGAGAVVNTGSFLASTGIFNSTSLTEALGATNQIQIFPQTPTPYAGSISVTNGASIDANAGFVLLQAPSITQNGTVSASDAVVYNADDDLGNGVTISPSAAGIALVDEQSFGGNPSASHIDHGGTTTAGTWFEVDAAEDVTTSPGFGGIINLGGHVNASGMKATGQPGDSSNGYSVILNGDAAGNNNNSNTEVTTIDASAGTILAASGIIANAGTVKTGLWTDTGGAVQVTAGGAGVEVDQPLVSTGAGLVVIAGKNSVTIDANVTAAQSVEIGSAGPIQVAPNVKIQAGSTVAGSSLTVFTTGSLFADPTSSFLVGPSVAAPNGALNISTGATIDVNAFPTVSISQTLVGQGGDLTLGSATAGSISLAATSVNNVGGAINIPGAISAPGEISLDATGVANVIGSITAGGSVFIAAGQLALGPDGGIAAGASTPIGGGTIATGSGAGNVIVQNSAASGLVPTALPPAVGDISIGAPMIWSNSSALTLNAYHSIVVSAPIADTASDSQVLLNTNQGGSGGDYSFVNGGSLSFIGGPSANQSLAIDGQAYTLIYSQADLLNINSDLTGFYALAGPLDFDTATSSTVFSAAPIASLANNPFFGTFTGLGNTISNLTISDTLPIVQTVGPGYATNGQVGLFGTVGAGGVVRDVNLSNANVSAVDGMQVGALVGGLYGLVEDASSSGSVQVGNGVSTWAGYAHAEAGGLVGSNVGTIVNSQSSADVSAGDGFAGGLAGAAAAGASISASSASGNVSVAGFSGVMGDDAPEAGGLVGLVFGFQFDGTVAPVNIAASFATGNVSGGDGTFVGGFAGLIDQGVVTTSYATGNVTAGAGTDVGGFAGVIDQAQVTTSYATGSVSETAAPTTVAQSNFAGGFVGVAINGATVTQSYASGAVTTVSGGTAGGPYALAGGFVGDMDTGSTISQAYALGAVTVTGGGANDAGGFVGVILGGSSADHVYATGRVSGTGAQAGLVGGLGDTSNPTHTAGFVSNSYWDSATTGQANGVNIVPLTGSTATNVNSVSGAGAYATANYGNFDLTNVWFIIPGETRPILRSEYSTTIANAHQLQLMGLNLSADYTLANDIDASETTRVSGVWNPANGFVPVGATFSAPFNGTLDGDGHTISNLFINNTSVVPQIGAAGFPTNGFAGLFGVIGAGGVVEDINLANAHVTGADKMVAGALAGANLGVIDHATSSGLVTVGNSDLSTNPGQFATVGGLVGGIDAGGKVSNSSSSASVTGGAGAVVGGLAGSVLNGSSISNSFATGAVSVGPEANGVISEAGGLVGSVYGFSSPSTTGPNAASVTNSYATGPVTGGAGSAIGGFAGLVQNGQITIAYATGSVTQAAAPVVVGAGNFIGGFAGAILQNSVVTQSYASGAVNTVGGGTAGPNVPFAFAGGFVGDMDTGAQVASSYSLGAVTATGGTANFTGGFAGLIQGASSADQVYATGPVSSTGAQGGLVGLLGSAGDTTSPKAGFLSNSYWDEGTTGQTSAFTPNGFAFANNVTGIGGPTGLSPYASATYMNFDLSDTWVMIEGKTRPVLRSEYSTTIANAHQLQLMGLNLGASYALANNVNASETTSASGVWNPANGFVPVGTTVAAPFAGSLNGQGHTISNLTIVDTTLVPQALPSGGATNGAVGLFGFVNAPASVIFDVNLANAHATGGNGMSVGLLVGDLENGVVFSASSSGVATTGSGVNTVDGFANANAGGLVGSASDPVILSSSSATVIGAQASVGGLVGELLGGEIENSSASGPVSVGAFASNQVPTAGGLVGSADFLNTTEPIIAGSYSTGNVTAAGSSIAGGFIGASHGVIEGSYSTGSVTQTGSQPSLQNEAGGFAGLINGGSVFQSFSTGAVNETGSSTPSQVGGFVGELNGGDVTDAYATGAVTVSGSSFDFAGGFVGAILQGDVTNVYATGAVTASGDVAGLAGSLGESGTITNGYWDEGTTGQSVGYVPAGGTANNVVGMGDDSGVDPFSQATYAGFDFGATWSTPDSESGFYPELYGVSHVLRIAADDVSSTYGQFPIYTLTATGLQGGDTYVPTVQGVQFTQNGAISFTSGYYDAGFVDLNVSGGSASGATGAYRIIPAATDGTLTVSPATLNLSAQFDEKTYDGGTSSFVAPSVGGLVAGDSVVASDGFSPITQSFDGPNAGPHTLSVDPYIVNDGNEGGNYTVSTYSTDGQIDPMQLTASLTGTVVKTYDGTTDATLSVDNYTLSSGVSGDDVSLNIVTSGAYDDRNAGSGKLVSVVGLTLSGDSASNYTVNFDASGQVGVIDPAPLTLTAVTDSKVYDGTTSSSQTPTYDPAQLFGSDNVSSLTQSFQSKNVLGAGGSALVVDGAYMVNDGNGGGNYAVNLVNASGTITPAPLVLNATSDTKQYDGGTSSGGTPTADTLFGDDSLTATQSFGSKDVLGEGLSTLSIDPGYAINDGNGGANYTVTQVNTASGTITPAPLTINAVTDSKQYDGGTSSSGTPTYDSSQVFGEDGVSGLSQAFDSKDVLGTGGSTLSVNGYTINDGNNGNDYTVTTNTAVGTITPAPLTINAVTDSKQYDGGTSSSGTPTYDSSQVFGEDGVSGLSQAFDSKNVLGTGGSTLSVNGYTINDGNDGNDYTVTTNTAVGTITPAPLVLNATSDSKQYDGGTSSGATPTADTLFGDDSLTATQSFGSKNVLGEGLSTLSIDPGYAINDGNGGANYTVTQVKTATGTITPAPLVLNATSDSKQYDGGTSSGATPTADTLFGDDSLTATQSFGSKNVLGEGLSTLSIDPGYTISDGNGGANYTVTQVNTATGTITPAPLVLNATSDSKQYDGGTSSGATPTADTLFGDDSLTATQSFGSKDVLGEGLSTLSIDPGYAINDGNGGANYTVTQVNTASGTITPAPLTINAVTDSKQYDGGTSSSGTPTFDPSQVFGEDGVSGLSQTFASKNVLGNGGSTLSVNGYTINDGNNGNDYTVTTNTASGTITPAPLVLNATSDSKQYDGGTSSGATSTADTLFGDDSLTATQSFGSKNVLGEGLSTLSIDPGYAINDGNGGANYTVTQVKTASGTITPAPLTASLVGTVDKTYDTTTAASLATDNYSLSGVIGTDDVSLNDPLSGTYDTKNAGAGKTVTVGNLAISGDDAANYTVNGSAAGPVGTIDRAPLTLTAVSDSKTYDGGVLSGGAPTYSGLLEGDSISNLAQSYDSRNAGSRTLLVTGYSIDDGNSGGNYAVTTTTASGAINPAALTLTAVGADKTYDGTTASGVTPGVAGLVSGDSLSNLAQSYDSKNAGARTLAVTSYTISDGNGGANYVVTTTTAAGTIDAKALTASLTGTVTKTYDGNTAATLADGNYVLSGLVAGDNVSLNDPVGGTYDSPNAGTNKLVSVGGLALSGADAANYTVNGSASGPIGTINAPPQTLQITVPVIDVTSSEFESATAAPAAAAAAAATSATSATVVNVFPVAPANDQTAQGDNSPITGAGNRDLWTSSDESDKDCPKTATCPANAGGKP